MKESEIRPKELFSEYLRLSKKDISKYFKSDAYKHVNCPACNSKDKEFAFSKTGFKYVLCKKCGTLYLSPRPPIWQFERFYAESPSSNFWAKVFFPAVAEARREKVFKPRVEQISLLCQRYNFFPDTVIEVGAGYGIFLEEWKKKFPKTKVCAIEPNPYMVEVCKKKGIEVLPTIAEKANGWFNKADLLVCFEVIEHVYSPFDFVSSLYRLVKPGGYILITGLGVEGFDILVLWEKSKSISPPHHINFMSIKGFEILFQRAGFTDIEVTTPGRLDVDIVLNALKEDQNLKLDRFLNIMLKREEKTLQSFQRFLSENKLSSHCWIWAKKSGKIKS